MYKTNIKQLLWLIVMSITVDAFFSGLAVAEESAQDQQSKLISIIESEQKAFEKEVIEYKQKILNDPSPVSHGDKKAYYYLLKSLRFQSLDKLQAGEQKQMLNRHKTSMLARKIAYDHLTHPDEDTEQILGIDSEGLAALSDLGWESANILNKPDITSKPQGTSITETNKPSSTIPLAAALNVGASGLSLGLTFMEAINYLEKHGSVRRLKKERDLTKEELAKISQQVSELENVSPEQNQDPLSHDYMLQKERVELEIKVREINDRILLQKKKVRKLVKSLSINSMLSSSYFSSSAMVLWGATSISIGIASNVLGGISYGSILGVVGAKGFVEDMKALKKIDASINETEDLYGEIQKEKYESMEFIEAWRLINFLKLNHLVKFQKRARLWNTSKNAFTFGLGTSVTAAGALGVAAAVGSYGTLSSVVGATGYGITALLGGAIISGGGVMIIKRHLKSRVHDFYLLKFKKKKAAEQPLHAHEYYKLKKSIKKDAEKYDKNADMLEDISYHFNSSVANNSPKLHLDELFKSMMHYSHQTELLESKIRKKQINLLQIKMLLQASNHKAREGAYRLFAIIDQLDENKIDEFSKFLGVKENSLEDFKNLEKKQEFLKFKVAQLILEEQR